jgi:hypothetical protein
MSELVPPMERMSDILAYDLGLTADEIVAFAAIRYGFDVDDASAEEVAAVRLDLDGDCARSVPELFWPSEYPDATKCRCRAMGGIPHIPDEHCPLPSRLEEREKG